MRSQTAKGQRRRETGQEASAGTLVKILVCWISLVELVGNDWVVDVF